MATLAQSFFSLADLYKRTLGAPGEKMATVINLLAKSNAVYKDMVSYECNLGTLHRHSIVTGLPDVSWGAVYEGITQSKSHRQQVDDTTGFVESLSSIDSRLLELSTDRAAVRLAEARTFLESMAQEIETAFFYADPASEPRKPKGMAPRYNTLSNANVVDAAGSGSDNTSVWFVTWGETDTCGLYPKGTMAGVDRKDMGMQRVLDGSGNPYYVEEELFCQHVGFAVKDWRNNARIANIDVSDLAAGSVDIHKFMTNAYYKLHKRRIGNGQASVDDQHTPGRTVIYMNKEVLEAIDLAQSNKGSSDNFIRLRPMELQGEEVPSWRGIPIRETDAILNTEAALS